MHYVPLRHINSTELRPRLREVMQQTFVNEYHWVVWRHRTQLAAVIPMHEFKALINVFGDSDEGWKLEQAKNIQRNLELRHRIVENRRYWLNELRPKG